MQEIDKAYWAGMFDGEGSPSLSHHKRTDSYPYNRYQCGIIIANSVNIFQQLVDEFGGHIIIVKSHKQNQRDSYQWKLQGKRAEAFVNAIYPYCRIKQAELDVFREFLKTMTQGYSGTGLPQVIIDKRNELISKMGRVRKNYRRKPEIPKDFTAKHTSEWFNMRAARKAKPKRPYLSHCLSALVNIPNYEELLEHLAPKLQSIVKKHVQGDTLEKIGSELDVTKERVRQVEYAAYLDCLAIAKAREVDGK